ncbi:MAG: hydantoinase/oxoprolinase family protein [SAR202 cluster bacterium]|nr:hydantoinase/oxoprolinase family protein [SAR202 cluster bacterium]
MKYYRVGIDIGGTFTDIVFLGDDGTVKVIKESSTPDDYSRAVITGINSGITELSINPENIVEVNHGFTVATNAILEGKGERMALITTKGFRDVLELSRIRTPKLYDLYYQKPAPLVERRFRLEVDERINHRGEILKPLNVKDVGLAVDLIDNESINSVAVCLLHSYANSQHEEMIVDIIKSRLPDVHLSISSQLLPEMKEYERTSTTVINGYVRPVVESYLLKLSDQLKAIGVKVPVSIMQSNGGRIPVEVATKKPMFCIESGPAAGVVGAFIIGKQLNQDNVITFDMGGTTAKASIIEDGEMLLAPEYEVGGGMNVGHRLLRGSGYILRVPAIDIAEVSAGGGSIAWTDKAGGLQIGPKSSGAVPGPACYSLGGVDPTVTDANVVLGYLNSKALLGGRFPIESQKAFDAISDNVGKSIGVTDVEAAWGVHVLANSNMGRALRAVSSERGRDPRKFSLMAFGGGGPIHASGLSETLGISRIIIPPSPGVFSAFGLLFADVEHHFVQTYFESLDNLDFSHINSILDKLKNEGETLLNKEGFNKSNQMFNLQLDVKYSAQTSELTININDKKIDKDSLKNIRQRFMDEHDKTYGYKVEEPIQLVSIRIVAKGISKHSRIPQHLQFDSSALFELSGDKTREVYFGSDLKYVATPIISRLNLDSKGSKGPLVIEEYDSTTVVPPRWSVSIDELQNIIMVKD